MENKCCIVGCSSNGYGAELVPVFKFPKKTMILKKNGFDLSTEKNWQSSRSSVIYMRHFDKKYI